MKRACACARSYAMWGRPVVGVAEGRKALHSRMLELRAVNEDLHMMTRENQVANGASITGNETCQPDNQVSDLVRLLSLTCVWWWWSGELATLMREREGLLAKVSTLITTSLSLT